MEVLKNMLVGLLAGDMVLWSLVVIVALVVWVVADAAILARGMSSRLCNSIDDEPLWNGETDINIGIGIKGR
jgi:hypothetical protein